MRRSRDTSAAWAYVRVKSTLIAGAALAALTSVALAQEMPGNPEMGRQIAEEYCVSCHDIGAGGAFKQSPPSFAAIAIYRSRPQIKMRILAPVHGAMPDYSDYMIGNNVDDMVAYNASLEERDRRRSVPGGILHLHTFCYVVDWKVLIRDPGLESMDPVIVALAAR